MKRSINRWTTTLATVAMLGLPVVGFAVQSYNNNVIVVGGKNVQSTYGADFGHRYNSSILLNGGVAP